MVGTWMGDRLGTPCAVGINFDVFPIKLNFIPFDDRKMHYNKIYPNILLSKIS